MVEASAPITNDGILNIIGKNSFFDFANLTNLPSLMTNLKFKKNNNYFTFIYMVYKIGQDFCEFTG